MKTTHQDKVMNAVNQICSSINRRILSMNYQQESAVREYVADILWDEDAKIDIHPFEARDIAEILEVNETCIFDVLVDLGFAAYEDEEKN